MTVGDVQAAALAGVRYRLAADEATLPGAVIAAEVSAVVAALRGAYACLDATLGFPASDGTPRDATGTTADADLFARAVMLLVCARLHGPVEMARSGAVVSVQTKNDRIQFQAASPELVRSATDEAGDALRLISCIRAARAAQAAGAARLTLTGATRARQATAPALSVFSLDGVVYMDYPWSVSDWPSLAWGWGL